MNFPSYSQWQTPGLKVLNDDQIYEIIQAAYIILEETGLKTPHSGALRLLKQAGALVREDRAYIPRHIVQQALVTVPRGFRVYDRQGRPALDMSNRKSYFGSSTASPKCVDAKTGEIHETRIADIANGALIADALKHIDWVMPFGSAQDIPQKAIEVHEFEAVVNNTTKPMVFCGYTPRGTEIVFEMAAAVAGGLDELRLCPFVISYPEPITPLFYPTEVVDKMFVTADCMQPQLTAGAQQPGGTAPVTMAACLAQSLAEAFASITLAQLYKPGCRCFMACSYIALGFDNGLMSIAGPEANLGYAAQAQIAQHFGLPTWGLAGGTDSKLIDAQAGAEAALTMLNQALAGHNLIHDVGYMDTSMLCSADQLVLGDEIAGWINRFMAGVKVNAETLALEVINKVGPGGNFLRNSHTLKNFRSEWWKPGLFTREAYNKWFEAGATDMRDRIRKRVLEILQTHKPTPLPDAVKAQVAEIRQKGSEELCRK